ncbi:MAG: type II secretion system protein [Deltaproteobacteria bacterium]|nr:type II secretion system protein [Deltaproteobacteria bacterium]
MYKSAIGSFRNIRKPPAANNEAGFSLLEVLVATGLMAVLAAIMLQVMTLGLRAQKASLNQAQALEVAGQVLQEYSREALLTPGTFQGNLGGYKYVVRIVPQYQVAAGRERTQISCFLITAAVAWGEQGRAKSVELSTVRTVARAAGL